MVLIDEEVLAEKRAAILALSLENAHEPKFGYFGFTGPLAIGDSSLAPQAKRKVVKDDDSGEPIKNMLSNPPKKGAGVDAYFSFAPPLSNGQDYIDPYIDPLLRTKKPKLVPIDPEKMFMPAGKVVTKIREGEGRVPELKKDYKHIASYVNLPEKVGFRDPLAMHDKYLVSGPKNFYTTPLKKGGGGIYTPGVLFGDPKRGEQNEGEVNFFWLHVPDEYDYWKKLKKADLEWHQSKLQEQNFNSMSYGNKCFFSDRETFFTELSRGIPREEKPNNYKPYPHEQPFFPSKPPRKGYNACLGEFPKHITDPVPEAKFVGKGSAEEGPPPWNPATKKVVGKPDPSVQTNMRNLRRENPRSFLRPVL